MYYKNHARRNFYSRLFQTAKRNQRYTLIQSTQNDSTSVEHNFKTLAQNKFNTRPKFYFLLNSLFALCASLVVYFVFICVIRLCFIFIYIDRRSRDANLVVYSRVNSNFLQKALCSNAPEHSTLFEMAKLGQKHITSLLSTEREKGYMK